MVTTPVITAHVQPKASDWRAIELAVIDTLRQIGCRVLETGGVAYVMADVYDEQTGQLVSTARAFNIEQFSRALANSLRP